jgi:hypothetical protein
MIQPPRGLSGMRLERFAYDLVSGWVGDPELSDGPKSPKLAAFLNFFHAAHVLRIRITKAKL